MCTDMTSPPNLPPVHTPSRRQRFFAGYFWLILKNVIGWTLIVASFVAGPLVPGPGGIPLFLIGFAMISFPGKRRLTARVLRGRRIRFEGRPFPLVLAGVSVVAPALALWLSGRYSDRLNRLHGQALLPAVGFYALGVAVAGLTVCATMLAANGLLRLMPRIRRRARPWLRRHRIRLLPPRRRRRLLHEHGVGPMRLKDEILAFLKRPSRANKHD